MPSAQIQTDDKAGDIRFAVPLDKSGRHLRLTTGTIAMPPIDYLIARPDDRLTKSVGPDVIH